MIVEIGKFYWECVTRAFSGRFWKVERTTGGLSLLALIITKFVPLPENITELVAVELPMYFFLLVFGLTVLFGLATAPFRMYAEERSSRIALEETRRPRLRLYLRDAHGTQEYRGHTTETIGGNRNTNHYDRVSNACSVVVENVGDTRIEKCVASLVSAERIEGEDAGAFDIFEPITLPWNPIDPEANLSASIEPSTKRRIWIANVNYQGFTWLLRDKDKLPTGYQQIFGPAGKYRAVIQVSDGATELARIKVEISGETSEPTKIYPSGTGKACITIVEEDAPQKAT